MKWILIIFSVFLFFAKSLSGQCPDRDFLQKRIIYLRDSSAVSPVKQLVELSDYLRKINGCNYKNDSVHTLLLQRIGWLSMMQSDFVKGIEYTRQSMDMVYANYNDPAINKKTLIQGYVNLTIGYDSLKQKLKKEMAMDSCIAVSLRLGTEYENAIFLIYLKVIAYFEKGDYYSCIRDASLGESITREIKNSFEYANYYIDNFGVWKINALMFAKRFAEAELLIALKINECIKEKNETSLGALYGLLASVMIKKADYDKALLYYNKSLVYNKKIGYNNGCAEALNNIGFKVYSRSGANISLAMKYYYRALKFANSIESLNIFDNIANAYVQKGKFDSAFYFFQKAFDYIRPGISDAGLLNYPLSDLTGNIEFVTNLILDKGDAFLAQYKAAGNTVTLGKALAVYRNAELFLTRLKEFQADIESKLFWRTTIRRLYEHAIEASFLSQNTNDAFYFFEKSRAVLLNDQLNEQQQLGENDILKLAQLKKKTLQLEKKYAESSASSKEYSKIQKELFINKQEFAGVQEVIKSKNPLYFQSFLDTNFISPGDVNKRLLNDHQAILELFNGDSAVYSMLITSGKTYLYKINKIEFDSTVSRYNYYLSNRGTMNAQYTGFLKTAAHLYQLIFQNHPLPPGRIIISPDGQYFPFESMVTSKPGETVNYFINDHAVSYTYSARFLLYDFNNDLAPAGKNFLGIAPVNYPASFSLASLAGSDLSLSGISYHFTDAVKLVAAAATRNNFLHQFPQYKIIQLYTHASDNSNNNEPVIYFADSTLYLSDLIGENKPLTRLIVLSACETGLGKEYKGEGVFSFNRGFAALGIPSSVTNLWTIDNESTYKLTELFYNYVADGLPLDMALQKAKLEFIKTASKEKQLPYYWAASILVGNTDSIPITKNRNWPYYAAAGIPVLLFILFIIIRKRKRLNPTPGKAEIVS